MHIRFPFLALVLFSSFLVAAQKPKNGIYTYAVAFAEWGGKSNGTTCTVKIRGDSITVINNGSRQLTGKKGDILDRGVIIRHKSGQWIIGHSLKDKNAEEVGGCTGGPNVIDFKRKKYWTC